MPGSKTYTSNKVNELLEIEMQESAKMIEGKKEKESALTLFMEVSKISLSILGTTYYNYLFLVEPADASSLTYENRLKLLINHIIGFIVLYIAFTIVVKVIRLIFEIIFSKRIFPSVKKESYNQFHKKSLNYIYIGVSFENKFNVYINQRLANQADPNFNTDLDLTMNYFSQAIYYFEKSYETLNEIIPQRIKPNGRKEKTNAKFLKSIGFSHILISLCSAHNSIERLYKSIDRLNKLIKTVPDNDRDNYSLPVLDLQSNHLEKIREQYDALLIRTKALKSLSDSLK